MEVYILTKYDPDLEQDVIVKVFDEMYKATEYVYYFSSHHYGHEGVSIVENLDHIEYTVRTKDGGILFYCDSWEVECKVIDDSCVRYLEDRVKELKEEIEEIEQRHDEELDPIKQELEDTEWKLAEARSILDMQKQEQE